ncbi:MAG: SiaB family protein kinase [Oscillospiraceae bacterium]|nr:SiaB family protein kinase [Oscillospiraceae bacterium]
MIKMLDAYNMVKDENIILIYSGPIWNDGMQGIAENLKKRLEFDELPLSASQSVFSVFVEQMNNILMYSAEKQHLHLKEKEFDVSKGMLIIGVIEGKSYFIRSGNLVKNSGIELIKSRIDHLNTLDKQQLRKFYKEQIRAENTNPESKGAGIGLIEIARRATGKIEYEFTPYKGDFSFFSMLVYI